MLKENFNPFIKFQTPPELSSDGQIFETLEENIQDAFVRQGEHQIVFAQHVVLNALASQIAELEETEPNLTEIERYILAKRIMQQRLAIYQSALQRL